MVLPTSIYKTIPLNISEIPQSKLNIKDKIRSNPLSWNGQFSPQLIQVLLQKYASPNTSLFDPFLGSGTLLLEAGRTKLAASGTEINPGAIVLSQTYEFINIKPSLRRFYLNKINTLLEQEISRNLPLFQENGEAKDDEDNHTIKTKLLDMFILVEDRLEHQLLETLIVLLDFYKLGLSAQRVFRTWNKLAQHINSLPYSERKIEVYHADARKTPLNSSVIDLIITSPPYINVFNYHQQYRASMEALSWNLLKVAKSEIGSNRKHRGNRFLTVIQYSLDLAQTLYEMARICKPTARLIFVVGRESTVQGTQIFNSEIVAEIASKAIGFNLFLRQERVFLNRFGQNIFEDILHFTPPENNQYDNFLVKAREIAKQVLESSYPIAPEKAMDDLKSAITKVEMVKPSPIFKLSDALKT